MDFWIILGIAVGLSMDAFAVSLSAGVVLPRVTGRHLFRFAFHFGLFQLLMPLLGWSLGKLVVDYVSHVDHWIAFGLLSFVGGKMIFEAFERNTGKQEDPKDPTRGWSLVLLSVATSIDALAVGLSIACLDPKQNILYPAAAIGAVCATISAGGMLLGKRVGALLGKRAEFFGGLVLIGIGVKVLVDHLWPAA